jgi:hypothetical protein
MRGDYAIAAPALQQSFSRQDAKHAKIGALADGIFPDSQNFIRDTIWIPDQNYSGMPTFG